MPAAGHDDAGPCPPPAPGRRCRGTASRPSMTRTPTSDQREARPADGRRQPCGVRRRQAQQPHGDERADRQLPGPRGQREEGPRARRESVQHERQREGRRGQAPTTPARGGAASQEPQRDEDQQRPDEVELLLDGERPEVQQRRGRGLARRGSRSRCAAKRMLETYRAEATTSPATSRDAAATGRAHEATTVTATTSSAAGSSRRTRRA